MTNNNFLTWNPQEGFIQQRILTTYGDFFYDTGRFPGRNTLIAVPRAEIPSFIESQDVLSPRDFYESFVGRDMQVVVSVQFLAVFNRFFGGDKEISRNALSEFFHNLSWQALTNDNDSVQVKSEAATELVKNINHLLQRQIYENKKKTIEIGKKIVEQLNNKEKETVKTEIEKVEEKVADAVIANDQTNYTPEFVLPTLKTEEEIDQDRLEWNRNFLATELAKKERDFEILDDVEAKEQHDLIKDAIDPSDGLLTNKEIDPTDYNRTIKNEPETAQLDPHILNIMKEVVNQMSDQVNSQVDEIPPLEEVPQIKYEPDPEPNIKPTLQDILTQPEPEEYIQEFENFKEEIEEIIEREPIDPLETAMPETFSEGEFDDTEFVSEYIPEFRSDQNRIDLDVRARTTHALVPTELEFESEDPADILADPNVTTILPAIEEKPYEGMVPLTDFLSPVAMAITPDDSEDEEDYKVWTPAKILAEPIHADIDENKFQVTDDGDVILTEPDNMQFEHKPLDISSEGVVALPPEENMDVVRTKNLILKRKQANNVLANIKKNKNETT